MSAATRHEIVWRFDRETVRASLVCNDPDCQYMYSCPEGCEVLYRTEPTDGGYRHGAVESFSGHVTMWHELAKGDECGFVTWMDNADDILELAVDSDQFEIGRTPVVPEWQGEDGVLWKRP